MQSKEPSDISIQPLIKDNFEQIYLLYFNKIYNLAFKITGSSDAAADITQETFIQVLTNADKYRGDSQIYTWIYAIAKNNCFKYIKKIRKNSFHSMEELIKTASFNVEYSQQEKQQYIVQVKDGCLLGLLRCLSFNQRIAFILNVLFDVSMKDVASVISKSENSTRILICRARKNIREFLCRNCSLYDNNNSCRCENLISFSLKQGWIEKYNPNISPNLVEAEIKVFKNEISLYKTIALRSESDDLKMKILFSIKEQKFNIFSQKKVK
ncbi:RNA polymerase sigma factor [Pseudobacteroides cellulosolvens]|uniref:RNA polymerase, sigma-24 subunit, RpoE, ECF subfamily n=1 Tax=Pseudobacteroides cellulosolvens ATCC 35603 = DSM 2933 TaxID=398512 RepID=A0A0L6JWM1_9FIRM|nr:RNA polymerase sigma factor [Pseudobacteroides cellulosolvens]KNY29827.1 RNA polymerase, sigma-24 subunit, RpoE, ECF subfamily [Pseudobacteroides cellulosolvens ATCC 35603 = DSM 2933]